MIGVKRLARPEPSGRAFFVPVLTVLFASIQGCATLPDAGRDAAQTLPSRVAFEGTGGPVSAARGSAILSGLERRGEATDVLQKHLAYEQAVNVDSPLVLGNKLTLLQDGPETYRSMFSAIRAATDNINLETYIFDDDDTGRQFADLLLERQSAGVQVNIIYDSVGALLTPAAFFDRLTAGGIRVLEFNPVNPMVGKKREWLLNNRDHRRQLLVDGRIAFTGGINISDSYASVPTGKKGRAQAQRKGTGWRDTHVRIEGPVVAEFQKLFMATWSRQHGDPLPPASYFPTPQRAGDEIVRAIGSKPEDKNNPIFLTLLSAISHAEHTVHLTIAYFAPDPQLRKALRDAAARGVDVRLVLPSRTDSWPIFNIGHSYYTELLQGGVHIHERRGSVMHAKTACIDGVWSTIGSTNMDWRSFMHNDEINAVVIGRGFAEQMEAMFTADLEQSHEIVLDQWRRRSWWMRIKERAARFGAYWL